MKTSSADHRRNLSQAQIERTLNAALSITPMVLTLVEALAIARANAGRR